MKEYAIIYDRNDRMTLEAMKLSGGKLYIRRLTPEENICVLRGTNYQILRAKTALFVGDFLRFREERRCSRMARARYNVE